METDPKLGQDKDIKTVIITIFHIFKKLSKISLKKSNQTSGEETYNG